jgi:hypothetical protein
MSKTIQHEAGFLGDHTLISDAISHGMKLDDDQEAWHNWEGDPTDPDYDEGLYETGLAAKKFLESKGFTITQED